MRKLQQQWGYRHASMGKKSIDEIEYEKAVRLMWLAVGFVTSIMMLEIVIW